MVKLGRPNRGMMKGFYAKQENAGAGVSCTGKTWRNGPFGLGKDYGISGFSPKSNLAELPKAADNPLLCNLIMKFPLLSLLLRKLRSIQQQTSVGLLRGRSVTPCWVWFSVLLPYFDTRI
jgi:hypothetical protein